MPAREIQVTIGNVTLNSVFTPGPSMYLLRNTEEILDALGTTSSDTEQQGAHGVQPSLRRYSPRELHFQGEIHATSQDERVAMQQQLEEALALPRLQSYDGDDGFKLLQIVDEDGIEKQLYAVVIQMPRYGLIQTGMPESRSIEFMMLAPEPEIFAQELTEETGPESYATTTFTIQDGVLPALQDGDLPGIQDATGSVMEVENEGTYPTPVLITIEGPTTNPVISNTTSGKKIEFSRNGGLTLEEGETLTINTAAPTAVKTDDEGTQTNVRSKISLDSEFFDLLPGANELTLFDDTESDLSGVMEVDFRSAWI